jgi:hypothetical protein
MPTFERLPRYKREYQHLSPDKQEAFKVAVLQWADDLKNHRVQPNDPRVEGIKGARGIFEFRWATDGRATFEWGQEQIPGEAHVVWRRVGTHEVLGEP